MLIEDEGNNEENFNLESEDNDSGSGCDYANFGMQHSNLHMLSQTMADPRGHCTVLQPLSPMLLSPDQELVKYPEP